MRLPAISTNAAVVDTAMAVPATAAQHTATAAPVAATAAAAVVASASAASGGARPAPEAAPAVDPAALRELVDKLSQTIGTTGQQVQFSIDNDTHQTILRVTDAESGAVLRQIPGDEALSMARILDRMQGILIRQKA